MANKLEEGVVGRKLIEYFVHIEGVEPEQVPVDAECIHIEPDNPQVQYRITFADGSVSDWLVTFEPTDYEAPYDKLHTIVSAEKFNEVI